MSIQKNSSPSTGHLSVIILALALGGFCIGTTEFVAMGLIQDDIAEFQA
jgi:DHA1 family inner membrane transport protein